MKKEDALRSLEDEALNVCSIGVKNFLQVKKQINTQMHYEQKKFNLIQEENEGFSKVITELSTGLTEENLPIIKDNIDQLIRYFNLDPNRVIDVILDGFSTDPHNLVYLDLMKDMKREFIS